MEAGSNFVAYALHFKPPIQPGKFITKVLELFRTLLPKRVTVVLSCRYER